MSFFDTNQYFHLYLIFYLTITGVMLPLNGTMLCSLTLNISIDVRALTAIQEKYEM